MKKYLDNLSKSMPNVKVLFEEENLGCSGGRKKAISYAKGDYIVTLDNDICVTPRWLEHFIMRIEADEKIAAACAKVVFPNGKVQYNGGSMKIEGDFVSFSLIDSNKDNLDFSTLIERDCDWIPGGAMIIKRKYCDMVSHRIEMQGSYEDNDYALQLKKLGLKLVNCPLTEVIHYHFSFRSNTSIDEERYLSERYNKERIMNSIVAFYKFNQLIIKDQELFMILGIPDKTDDDIINFVKKRVNDCIGENLCEDNFLCSSEELSHPEIISH
jgi:GT2 family glycosyltransferase